MMASEYMRWLTLKYSAIDIVLDIFITSGGFMNSSLFSFMYLF